MKKALVKISCSGTIRRVLGLIFLLYCLVSGAAELPVQGTIQLLQQDAGIIRISGRDLRYEDSAIRITVGSRDLGAEDLSEGMLVSYTVNSQGYLSTIVILGPQNVVDEFDNN